MTTCETFIERLNAVLDGDAANALAADPHLAACADCRARFAATKSIAAFKTPVPELSPNFTENVLARAAADRQVWRRQQLMVRAAIFALAASLLVGVWLSWPKPTPPNQPQPLAQGLVQPLQEARAAFVSLSETVAEDSFKPAANLFAVAPVKKAAKPSDDVLADLPEAAKAGFEPLVSTPRRALNLFLSDVGGTVGARKPSS